MIYRELCPKIYIKNDESKDHQNIFNIRKDMIMITANFLAAYLDIPTTPDIYLYINDVSGDKGLTSYNKEIEINCSASYGMLSIVETVAHEMVHIQQIYRGDVEFIFDDKFNIQEYIWKPTNKKYSVKEYNMHRYDGQMYLTIPWEKEAYAREKKLGQLALDYYLAQQND